ncbi:MAG TPA: hypothetical protein VHP12_05730, partial [Chitinophagaceae bacterium]|nr:hypothetical protein [Chitinophagaceae bacterium]
MKRSGISLKKTGIKSALPSLTASRIGAEIKIGKHVAELIDDGSTLQMGVGIIPDAVLKSLHNHKD